MAKILVMAKGTIDCIVRNPKVDLRVDAILRDAQHAVGKTGKKKRAHDTTVEAHQRDAIKMCDPMVIRPLAASLMPIMVEPEHIRAQIWSLFSTRETTLRNIARKNAGGDADKLEKIFDMLKEKIVGTTLWVMRKHIEPKVPLNFKDDLSDCRVMLLLGAICMACTRIGEQESPELFIKVGRWAVLLFQMMVGSSDFTHTQDKLVGLVINHCMKKVVEEALKQVEISANFTASLFTRSSETLNSDVDKILNFFDLRLLLHRLRQKPAVQDISPARQILETLPTLTAPQVSKRRPAFPSYYPF